MKRLWLLPVLLMLSGCFFSREPFVQVVRYDLATPPPLATGGTAVEVKSFRSMVPAGRNLLFREAGDRLIEEQNLAWSQMPEMLIQRYLARSFAAADVNLTRSVQLSGTVFEFNLDRVTKKAELGVNYEIRFYQDGDLRKTVAGSLLTDAPLDGFDGAAAAAAMSGCAAKLAEKIAAEIAEPIR